MANKKVLKVGAASLNKPTPKFLTYIFRAYTFIAGLWAIISPSITHIPPLVLAEINKWILIGVPVIQFTIKFFSFDYKMSEDVD